MARLLGLDCTGPLMTTCSHMYRGNMVLYWAPKQWTNGVRKVMRNLLMSPRWKTWVWTLKVEHLVLGVGGRGNESWVVRDDWLRFVAQSGMFPRLTSINLGRCGNITDAGLSALAQGCPQLTSINLECCRKMTDAGVSALARGCPQLTSINLSGCNKMTDAGLSALARGCPHLTSINLDGCYKITDAGRNALRQGCPQLKW